MGYFDILDEIIDDDLLFILKYGLIISNFITIIILLFFRKTPNTNEVKSVLVVTAHPDDEAMFFLPTIQYLKDNQYEIHLLCLSNGNANNLGKVRESELEKCCKYLKIDKLTIVNNELLQDSMTALWPIETIKQIVEKYIDENNIKGVITFDGKGISGHLNHIACYNAVNQIKKDGVKFFALETTNIWNTALFQIFLYLQFLVTTYTYNSTLLKLGNPCKFTNLSLSGIGNCSLFFQDTLM